MFNFIDQLRSPSKDEGDDDGGGVSPAAAEEGEEVSAEERVKELERSVQALVEACTKYVTVCNYKRV